MSAPVELHVQIVDAAGPAAPWVLCVHSSGLMGKQWLQLVRRLRTHYRIAVPDLIGYGASAPWPGALDTFSVSDEVAALVGVLDALDDRPLHLVGHSYGGFLVLELARRAFVGELDVDVASVAAFEPTVWGVLYDEPTDAETRAARDAFQSVLDGPIFHREGRGAGEPAGDVDPAAGRPQLGDETWLRGFVDFWNGEGAWDSLTSPRRRSMLGTGRKTAREVLELCYDRTPTAAWSTIDAPTLLLVGRDSNRLERAAVSRLAATLPHGSLHTVEGGHMAPIQNASEVNDALMGHIERHTA